MLTTGTLLQNRYRIDRMLEFGVMGAMYRAWDTRRDKPVSVKELTPQPDLDRAVLDRLRSEFEREAQILRTLRHPAMATLHDFFHAEDSGNTYLVMDFVEGESLADYITRVGALPEAQVKVWAAQILDALEFCHSHGVLHRDIKPQNIILRPDGQAVPGKAVEDPGVDRPQHNLEGDQPGHRGRQRADDARQPEARPGGHDLGPLARHLDQGGAGDRRH